MKKILIGIAATVSLSLCSMTFAQSIPNPADRPELGKLIAKCYKYGKKLKKNRVVWQGKCYVKPDCGDGYVYGPSVGACMQDNGGGE